jgi:Tfp pilus assembly protein PilP
VVKITKLAIAVAVIWFGAAGAAQDKTPAPVAKAPEAEQKAKAPSGRNVAAPEVKSGQAMGTSRRAAAIRRDPFRPFTVTAPASVRQRRENLSPLERYEIGQLKLVGIVWDIKNPTALVENTSGLGYTLRVGTPIGVNDGKVKAIRRNEIVVEEFPIGADGARKVRDVVIKLSAN